MGPSDRENCFLIGFGDGHDPISTRLLDLGYRPVRAEDVDRALLWASRGKETVRAALIPVWDGSSPISQADLERLAVQAAPLTMNFIAVGKRPNPEQADELRRDGFRFRLSEPYSNAELRFVVNCALFDRTRGKVRGELRVPIDLDVSFWVGAGGDRPACLYNLSPTGAYLQSERAAMKGARIHLRIPLKGTERVIRAEVISNNVTGNLHRRHLPKGMGIRFVDLEPEDRAAIEELVSERLRSFEL